MLAQKTIPGERKTALYVALSERVYAASSTFYPHTKGRQMICQYPTSRGSLYKRWKPLARRQAVLNTCGNRPFSSRIVISLAIEDWAQRSARTNGTQGDRTRTTMIQPIMDKINQPLAVWLKTSGLICSAHPRYGRNGDGFDKRQAGSFQLSIDLFGAST